MTEVPRKFRKLSGELKKMKVRPMSELNAIRDRYGSPVMAAMLEQINPEEYLKLEQLSEH